MPLVYETPDNQLHCCDGPDDDARRALHLVLALGEPASASARRRFGLPRRTTVARALAAAAGVDAAVVEPLTRVSSGAYTEDDYLADFEEDWEREEYGRHAAKVVARNRAAWQAPGALAAAVDAALSALRDPSVAAVLLDEDWQREAPAVLASLRRSIQRAIDAGAVGACFEVVRD